MIMKKLILYSFFILPFIFMGGKSFSQKTKLDTIIITTNYNGIVEGHFRLNKESNKDTYIVIHGKNYFNQLKTISSFKFSSVPTGEYMISLIEKSKITSIRIYHGNI